MSTALTIKGVRDGLLVSVPEGNWTEVASLMLEAIDQRVDFFRGARITLQLEDHEVRAEELSELRQELEDRGLSLVALLSTSAVTRSAATDLGLLTQIKRERSPEPEDSPFNTELEGEEAMLVERTLRAGHQINYPGHVVILGDVNPGAEIVAGGHVLIWGRLRGVVHAGATGDEKAVVCALDLSPTQLRIAGQIAVSPERQGGPRPEIARIKEGQLVAEPWRGGGRR